MSSGNPVISNAAKVKVLLEVNGRDNLERDQCLRVVRIFIPGSFLKLSQDKRFSYPIEPVSAIKPVKSLKPLLPGG